MPRESISYESRFHLEIFDESGATLPIENLTREEFDDFRFCHSTDDLNYHYQYGPERV